jgi:hypothetical protein
MLQRLLDAAPPGVRSAARRAFEELVMQQVRGVLAQRSATQAEVAAELERVRVGLRALERRVADARARFDGGPVHRDTTVHAAHARHPGVAALFARRGLPRCTDCAVGADETLAEAALGEGFEIDALLEEIHALLRSAR